MIRKQKSDSRGFEKQPVILGTASQKDIISQSPEQPLWKDNRLIQQETFLEVPLLFSFAYFQLPQSSAMSHRLTNSRNALPPYWRFFCACLLTPWTMEPGRSLQAWISKGNIRDDGYQAGRRLITPLPHAWVGIHIDNQCPWVPLTFFSQKT